MILDTSISERAGPVETLRSMEAEEPKESLYGKCSENKTEIMKSLSGPQRARDKGS